MAEILQSSARQVRAAEARGRLLAAAVKQFSERSYDVVAVADITGAADTAHGSLFHHFGSKRGIYLATMEEIAAQLRARRSQNRDAPGVGRLRAEFEAHFGAIAEHPGLFVSLMRGGIGADPEAQAIFERDRWHAIEIMAGQLGLDFENPTVRVALRGAIGGADHAVLAWLEYGRPFPSARLVDGFFAVLAGTLDSIAVLDPAVDVSRARAALRLGTRPPRRRRAAGPRRRRRG
jgi:AcrR family transcriptional regulator